MSETVYLGTLQEDLWSVAWRVQRLAGTIAIVVWVDEHGAIYAADEGSAPVSVTPAMLIGVYKAGASVQAIEEDLSAAGQRRP